ncbi:hypothetical protein [Synechococcus phage MinM1]|nr:hypothetical protein [Synechococcus phage MinM1]
MNAITHLNARAVAGALPQDDLLALRRARLAQLMPAQLGTQHLTLRWHPDATPEERIALATLLLGTLPFRIVPTEPTT